MGFLEDLQRGAQNTIDNIGDAFKNVGNDAQAALDQATRNTAALAGSGVNQAGQIFGPAAEAFGKDPTAFVLNVARKTSAASRQLLGRVAKRTGKLSYVFDTPQGKRKVVAAPSASANANQIALTLALCALDSPATMAEEAGRMANGLPVKDRGLMGYTVYPMGIAGVPRGIFGIDDAAVLAILVPIIAAIATQVLPGLISAAGNIISQITKPQPSPEEQKAAADAAKQQEQQQTFLTVGIVAGVLLLVGGAVVFAMRHKHKAAA